MQVIWLLEKNYNHKPISLCKKPFFVFFIFIFAISLQTSTSYAQDPHFSQFFVSPLTLNPAYTGKFDGRYRFIGNHRKQWPTINNAFTTSSASYDFALLNNILPIGDTWGLGFSAMNDQSGNKIVNNNFGSISTAYSKALDEDGMSQITIGFQGTIASKRLDLRKADFEDELTNLGFTGITSEVFGNNPFSINYFDFNTGILLAHSTNGENSIYLGGSLYHLNKPKESFLGGNYTLNSRTTIHGGGYFPIGLYKTLHTSFIYQNQAGATEKIIGATMAFNVNYQINNPVELYVGGWYRFGDALIPYVGLELNGFRFGLTHDITTSTLRPASNYNGGTEISIIYIGRFKDPTNKKVNCPKF